MNGVIVPSDFHTETWAEADAMNTKPEGRGIPGTNPRLVYFGLVPSWGQPVL